MSKRKNVSREFIDNSDDSDDTGSVTKKAKLKESKGAPKGAKAKATTTQAASNDVEEKLELSPKRYVCVRTFKGKIMVDIREYWEDSDGELKPGKKGIALSMDQWEKLKGFVTDIDKKIREIS